MARASFFLVFVQTVLTHVYAYGTGSPCVAQHNLQPSVIFHGTTQDLVKNPPPYAFSVENSDGKSVRTYVPGKVYTVKITAKSQFRGFLLQGRVATKEKTLIGILRAGEFISDSTWETQGIQYQQCLPKSNDSITHLSNNKKKSISVKWKVNKNVGPVQFVATLVAEQSVFWEAWQPDTGYLTPAGGSREATINEAVVKNDQKVAVNEPTTQKSKTTKVASSEENDEAPNLKEKDNDKDKKDAGKALSTATASTTVATATTSSASSNAASTSTAGSSSTGGKKDKDKEGDKDDKKGEGNDACSGNECKNGASCQVNGTGYACKCTEGYVGKFCQWQCPTYLCQNGGTCSIDQSSNYVCTCAEGFSGNHCEESKNKTTKRPKSGSTERKSSAEVSGGNKTETDSISSPSSTPSSSATSASSKTTLKPAQKPNSSDEDDDVPESKDSKSGKSVPPAPPADTELESRKNPSDTFKGVTSRSNKKHGNNSSESFTTEEPVPTTTEIPINPFVKKLHVKLLDTNNVIFTNGLKDIKSPDPCEEHQCTHGGECIADKHGYTCKCHGEYDGPFCQWDCPAYLCRNGGKCYIDDHFNYLCKCATGYVGSHCEIKNFTEPEEANATDIFLSIKHLFAGDGETEQLVEDAFNGTVERFDTNILEKLSSNSVDQKKRTKFIKAANQNKNASELINILIEADYCASFYCYNDGNCLNNHTIKKPYCNCSDGWTGANCDKKDHCFENKCDHKSECINGASNYTCLCKGEFAGKFCSTSCPPTLCSNRGKCGFEDGKYNCLCDPGFTGDRCQTEIDECQSNPCQNGATCIDRWNGYECKCSKGFMGSNCHRPCEDVYKNHCDVWKREGKCDLQSENSNSSRFFENNCALTCGRCISTSNKTIDKKHPQPKITLPPTLEPFEFLLGKWSANASDAKHFPLDYEKSGYYEELEFTPGEVLLFGNPALNYSSIAVGNGDNSSSVQVRAGFLSIRINSTSKAKNVTLMSIGSDGLTIMEEGEFGGDKEIVMNSQIISIATDEERIPVAIKRSLAISGAYLRETLERRFNDSTTDYYTKYYSKKETYEFY